MNFEKESLASHRSLPLMDEMKDQHLPSKDEDHLYQYPNLSLH